MSFDFKENKLVECDNNNNNNRIGNLLEKTQFELDPAPCYMVVNFYKQIQESKTRLELVRVLLSMNSYNYHIVGSREYVYHSEAMAFEVTRYDPATANSLTRGMGLRAKCQELWEAEQGKSQSKQESTPLWKQVLNQKEFYNGHGEMVLSEITLTEALHLCEQLTENINEINDIFILELCPEELDGEKYISGIIKQCSGLGENEDKIWISFDKVVIEGDD